MQRQSIPLLLRGQDKSNVPVSFTETRRKAQTRGPGQGKDRGQARAAPTSSAALRVGTSFASLLSDRPAAAGRAPQLESSRTAYAELLAHKQQPTGGSEFEANRYIVGNAIPV